MMAADISYYRFCRRTDPTYTPFDAYKEYLSEHLDEAWKIAEETSTFQNERIFYNWDEVEDYIEGLSKMDAFDFGRNADISGNGPWHLDGYDNLEPLDVDDFALMCATDQYTFYDMVCEGDIDVDPELAEILALWDVEVSYGVKHRSRNTSPTRVNSKKSGKGPSKSKTVPKTKSATSKSKKPVRNQGTAKRTNVSKAKPVGKTVKGKGVRR
ncbi:MAG: hypothetical protein E7Z63_01060 [Thermoplasmata archaeon]|nr:hypothetical protein [Thermoplasmata archaeon]